MNLPIFNSGFDSVLPQKEFNWHRELSFKTTTGKYSGGIIKYIEAEGVLTVCFKFGCSVNIYFNSFLNPQGSVDINTQCDLSENCVVVSLISAITTAFKLRNSKQTVSGGKVAQNKCESTDMLKVVCISKDLVFT